MPKEKRPSARDERALIAILQLIGELGRAPTVRELGAVIGLKPSATQNRIDRLRTLGFLRKDSRIAIDTAKIEAWRAEVKTKTV